MGKMMYRQLVRFVQEEDGPTAVEYAVMLALIIVVCLTAITTLERMPTGVQQCRSEHRRGQLGNLNVALGKDAADPAR